MGACLSTPHDVTDGVLSVSGDETVPTKSLEIPTPPPPRVSLILAAKLKLRLGAKAKESRERLRARHEGDVFIDASDSGPVEVAVSNLRIDHTRLVSAGLHSIDAVTLTLYHRRRVGVLNETSVSTKDVRGVATNDAEESKTNTDFESQKKRAQTRWVAIHTTNCYPDNTKNGDLTPLGFRERNGRNLSKHKAPVFFLPDGLSSAPETIRLVVAMSRKTSAKSAQRRMDWRKEDGRGGIDQVAVPRSVTHEFATTPSAQTKQLSENVILGESYFSIRDLLVANTRKKQLQLNTSRGAAGFGAVASKSGAVTLCVTPQGISRDWQRSSGVRARTAPGHLSFESLLKRFDESRDFVTNDARGPDKTKQSWAQKKQKNDEAPRVTLRTRGNSIHDSSTRLGRTYVSSGGSGKGIRTRGSGSLRRGDDPGFDDEDDAFDAVAGCSGAVVGQVLSSEPNTSGGKTKGHKLLVECGEQKPVVVVCHVPVDVDALVCVALAGSLIGEQVVEENAVVKGVVTGGQICTSAMLGWDNAEKDSGVVELRAGSLLIGDPAPGERPKARKAKTLDALGNEVALNEQVDALFVTKPKVSKEERAAEREAKRALKGKDKEDGKDDPAEVALGENGKPVASKAQTKLLKKQIADKRKAGEEVYTDDEFEGAGFAPP